jgi:predicted GH43/DUF377 family glycosyl hydrolase
VTSAQDRSWVRRTPLEIRPDPHRVVDLLFLPGQELEVGESRSSLVLDRILAMSETEVGECVQRLRDDFSGRHRALPDSWADHARLLEHRLDGVADLTDARRLLIGAAFTQEFSLEGAALCNPSMVEHPDQSGLADGERRFVTSLRAIGEGHISSMELRTGVVDASGSVTLDEAPAVAVRATTVPHDFSRALFLDQLQEMGGDRANSDFVMQSLPEQFTRVELFEAVAQLSEQRLTRGVSARTVSRFERIAGSNYRVEFPESSCLQERVLLPRGPAESKGIEDVRWVRVTDDEFDGQYLATYTAYDGHQIESHLLRTSDFRSFESEPFSGPGAKNKGMALFPRQVGGRYVALSRADRENNALTTSSDMRRWSKPTVVQRPQEPWESVQLGNCGSPIETAHGWLVLTHGVGPMRRYCIGAILLNLTNPTQVIGRLRTPLLEPIAEERSGYVPNVVYSCGGMVHDRMLVLPYGCSDSRTRFATIDMEPLIDELLAAGP